MNRTRAFAAVLLGSGLVVPPAFGQASQFALRFHGTGQNQQDRVRIPIDDNVGAADASAPCDVGAAGFTIEFWMKGTLAANASPSAGGDVETPDLAWRTGNVIVDRDILGGSDADFGVSIAGGFVRFGTGKGDAPGQNGDDTIEGNVNVLDSAWHHVAVTRDATTGTKRIYVDGALDFQSAAGASTDDLSYPNAGVPAQQSPWGPYLVLGAEKHDVGPQSPSFDGWLDELRVWKVARTASQILEAHDRIIPATTANLVGAWRFEEGSGTSCADSSAAGSPAGQLIAGVPGNGEWVSFASSASNTAPISFGILPPGFQKTTLTTALVEPTVMEFAPDGRLFIAERGGRVLVWQNGALLGTPLIQLAVDTYNGERGIAGMALHPDFANNGWLYLFHTSTEPRDRVSRFTVAGNAASPASEVVIWQNTTLASDWHHGGGLRFGPDGKLYIAVGDQFDSANSQDLSKAGGKLLRLTDTGAVPADNPFVATPGAYAPIWASGLRNPFRLTTDLATSRLWIGDVGGNVIGSWEEVELAQRGANYGWPDQEGPLCQIGTCSGVTFPRAAYAHQDAEYFIIYPQGSVTLGPVYRNGNFPADYAGNIFIADYANRWIRRLIVDANGVITGDPLFLFPPYAGTIVDLKQGPDGALYYLNYGAQWSGVPDQAGLSKIQYVPAGNVAPIVAASATPASGAAPLSVNFSSAGSFDPDNGPQPVQWSWTFGDGGTANTPSPSHAFVQNGVYTASLRVSDGSAETTSAPITIEVGHRPVPVIATPANHAHYRAGDTIVFSGGATDFEDGALPAAALSWQVVLVHDEHVHPFLGPLTGVTGGNFQVPSTGHAPDHTHFEIRLTATDADGLAATATCVLEPDGALLALATLPAGVALSLDGAPLATPAVVETLIGFQHEVAAPASATIGGQLHAFQCWSDGGGATHSLAVTTGGKNLTAVYQPVSTTTASPLVAAANRNAEFAPGVGQQPFDPLDANAVGFGRDASGALQAGFEFTLAVPHGATIAAAHLEFVATNDQSGSPTAEIRAYDVASAPAFTPGSPTALTSYAPLTGGSVQWAPPLFANGQTYASPDVSALVQSVVDRGDWANGNVIGFTFDGAPTPGLGRRSVKNFASGQPAKLVVTWAVLPGGGGGCPPVCGFTTYGPTNVAANHLALVGGGTTAIGGVASIVTTGLGSATSCVSLISLTPGDQQWNGGRLLVNPVGYLATLVVPASEGESSWSLPILNSPAVIGVSISLQSAAADPSQPIGVALSNGLTLTVCGP